MLYHEVINIGLELKTSAQLDIIIRDASISVIKERNDSFQALKLNRRSDRIRASEDSTTRNCSKQTILTKKKERYDPGGAVRNKSRILG